MLVSLSCCFVVIRKCQSKYGALTVLTIDCLPSASHCSATRSHIEYQMTSACHGCVAFLVSSGMDEQSWGLCYKGTLWHGGVCRPYTQQFIEANTLIGVYLNLYEGTLTYFKNGQCLGVAFHGLNKLNEPLFPLISSTAEDTEMEVGTTAR